MAKINRYDGDLKAFASSSTGTNRTVFGDVTQSDTLDDNVNSDYLSGWEIVGVNENPTKQDFNAVAFTLGQLLAYLHQVGVAEWNTSQEYNTGSAASRNGIVYISQTDSNTGTDPEGDVTGEWRPAVSFVDFGIDSGAADAYEIDAGDDSSGVIPVEYRDGMEISFFASADNTTTTPTADAFGIGAETIVREDGSTALDPGDITTTVMTTLRYDLANTQWLLIRGAGTQSVGGSLTTKEYFTVSGNFNVPAGVTTIRAYLAGAGGGGAGGGSAGNDGSASTFSTLTANGGQGAAGAGTSRNGATNGTATGGDINIEGGGGAGGPGASLSVGGSDQRSNASGGSGGLAIADLTVTPSSSIPVTIGAGGSGGSDTGVTGEAGADGYLIVEYVA